MEGSAAFLVLVSITVAAWVWRRTRPYLLMGWLWYLGMLVPVIGLVQIGIQAVADRFTYLPQIGLGIALAWGAADLCRSSPRLRRLCGGASVLVLALLMDCAWRQTTFWHDSEALWTHTLACTSRNGMAHTIFATGLARWGRVEEALDHFRQAIEFQPDDAVPRCNVADILAKQGRLDEAMAWYRDVLKIQPGCVTAHNNLGQLLARQGRFDEAAEQYRRALQIQPDLAVAYWNLGNVLLARGRLAEAESQYRKALEIAPDYAMARNNLANALAKQGRLDEAIAHYQRCRKLRRTMPRLTTTLAPPSFAWAGSTRHCHSSKRRCKSSPTTRKAKESGLAAGDLPAGVAAKRRRGDRACSTGRPALWKRAAGRAGCAGCGLCRSGPIPRRSGHRPQGPRTCRATKQSTFG